MKNAFLIIAFVLSGSLAMAGGMVSSGGELLKNARNPWWLFNAKEVTYCLQIDAKTFSGKTSTTELMVQKAIEFWKSEFTRPLKISNNRVYMNSIFNQIGVGLQKFVRVTCSDQVDLQIQFGYGALTDEQRQMIPNLKTHVSAAVRTSYDEVNLRGRGFIYVASDIGPNRYNGGPEMIEKPWQYEIFLFYTLVHEFGHVFGLPHMGEANSLMSERFVESFLNKAFADHAKYWSVSNPYLMPFFFAPANYIAQCKMNGFSPLTHAYLGVPAGMTCLHFLIDGDNSRILVYASANPWVPWTQGLFLGTISSLDLEADAFFGITVFLTRDQKVFPATPNPYQFISGPLFIGKKGSATFYSTNGLAQPLYIDMNPVTFTLVGLAQNSLRTVLAGRTSVIPHY